MPNVCMYYSKPCSYFIFFDTKVCSFRRSKSPLRVLLSKLKPRNKSQERENKLEFRPKPYTHKNTKFNHLRSVSYSTYRYFNNGKDYLNIIIIFNPQIEGIWATFACVSSLGLRNVWSESARWATTWSSGETQIILPDRGNQHRNEHIRRCSVANHELSFTKYAQSWFAFFIFH